MSTLTPASLEDYVWFVTERHAIWGRRRAGMPRDQWTEDATLKRNMFCNMFRVLDAGSQYVARELMDPLGDDQRQEGLFRAMLYRYTNLPDPFEYFRAETGRLPEVGDLGPGGALREIWGDWQEQGGRIFSGAYAMGPGVQNTGVSRLEGVLRIVEGVIGTQYEEAFLAAEAVRDRVKAILPAPRVGVFMALQTQTDFGYRYGDTEDQWADLGPGSRRGLARLFPGKAREEDALLRMRELQSLIRKDARAPVLWTKAGQARGLSIMDIQNTLCEFDKYIRARSGESARLRVYRGTGARPLPPPFLPRHWGSLDSELL